MHLEFHRGDEVRPRDEPNRLGTVRYTIRMSDGPFKFMVAFRDGGQDTYEAHELMSQAEVKVLRLDGV